MNTILTTIKRAGTSTCALAFVLIMGAAFSKNSFALSDALKIHIEGNGYSDETVIRFLPGATAAFDASCDAWKLFSTNYNAPAIFTKALNGDALAINTLPPLSSAYTTGLFLNIGQSTYYSFSTKELGAFAPGVCIILFDQVTGNFYNLRDTSAVNYIYLPLISKNDPARFIINFSLPASVITTNATCSNCTNGNAIIKKAGWSNWQYTLSDSSGSIIASGTSPDESLSIGQLAPGKYNAIIHTQTFTSTDSVWFHVNEGDNTLGTNTVNFNSECKFSYYDGAFHVETDFNEAKNFTAQIIDLEGKSICTMDFSDTKQLNNIIKIGNIAPGVYAGMIQGKDFSSVKKIMVSE